MSDNLKYASIIALAGILFFLLGNSVLSSSLNNLTELGRELKTQPTSIQDWTLSNEAPFKYRVLHKYLVQSTYVLSGQSENPRVFFTIYKGWALVFYISVLLSFFYLLKTLKFNNSWSLAGTLFLLLCPPFIMAYSLPVHTREDMLGYTLLVCGLICIFKNKYILLMACTCAGVLCRETLLVLPLFYMYYAQKETIFKRFLPLALGILVFVLLRLFIGYERYNLSEGLYWNLDNPEQVIGFGFLTFGFFWLPFFLMYLRQKGSLEKFSPEVRAIVKSAPWMLGIVIITTFLGGIFNEIRLLFLSFPWVLISSLTYMHQKSHVLKIYGSNSNIICYFMPALVLFSILTYFLVTRADSIIPPSRYPIPFKQWIAFTMLHITLLILFTKFFFTRETSKQSIS
ncbi:hypothetical protein FNH22_08670 [Fulvivirga sp. M361]|uniref:hypothetical protein n=1 Tax=Fulvivirga sp. M361 TaxID=2594266 RepID=UPI00117B7C53|nr:hypothetical protein [Fulvivirga sp. M361]TRX60112.1 hypothetical protein FNH22_08670 [Fulvivirga sp. M361]